MRNDAASARTAALISTLIVGLSATTAASAAPARGRHVGHVPRVALEGFNVDRAHAARKRAVVRHSGKRKKNGESKTADAKADLGTVLPNLHLSTAQKATIDGYQAKADADGKVAYANRKLTPDQFIGRMDQIHNDLLDSIRSVLTPEQRTRFNAGMAR